MSKPRQFRLWLCGRQVLTTLAADVHDDVTRAVEAAKEYLVQDEQLLKVEVHSGRAHICSIGRGWMSKSCKHFGDNAT
jgi:hypothetical protein